MNKKKPSFKKIREKVNKIDDTRICIALDYSKQTFENEEKRRATVESKAFNLIGIAGVSASIVFAFGTFLLGKNGFFSWIAAMDSILFLIMAVLLVISIFSASNAVRVDKYYSVPKADDFMNLSKQTDKDFYREHVSSLHYAFLYNQEVNGDKINYLIKAEKAFRNFILVLIFFTLFVFMQILILNFSQWEALLWFCQSLLNCFKILNILI